MNTTTVVVDDEPTIPPAAPDTIPAPPFMRNHGRALSRDLLLSGRMQYNKPPDPKRQGQTTAGTLNMLVAREAALADARKRGVEPRGVRQVWEKEHDYELMERVLPKEPGAWSYRCMKAGQSGELEPKWLETTKLPDTGAHVVSDGTAVWVREKRWTGRVGYGGMGMKEIISAMRMPPMEANRKARNSAHRLRAGFRGIDTGLTKPERERAAKVAPAAAHHTPAHKRKAREWRVRRAERLEVKRAAKAAKEAT